MRCKDVEAILHEVREDKLSDPAREHLSGCPDCRDLGQDLRLLRTGFSVLAQDPIPEASFGFGERVVRRLESAVDSSGVAADFLEQAGRRFVLASLLLTMSLLLAFALPSSGPLRGPSSDEPYLTQPEANTAGETNVLADDFTNARDASPANLTKGSEQKQK